MKRFTWLTSAFSKKIENPEHAVFMHYYFARIHMTLKVTHYRFVAASLPVL